MSNQVKEQGNNIFAKLPIVKSIAATSASYRTLDRKDRKRFWIDGILNNALYILMFVFIVFTALKRPAFLGASSLVNIVSQVAIYLPIALGIGGCIVLTGTDLSAGRIVGLSAAVSAVILQQTNWPTRLLGSFPDIPVGLGIVLSIVSVMLVGGIIGLVNGFFVAKFKLHPFIVTLATQLITYGLILMLFMTGTNNGQPLSGLQQGYKDAVIGTMLTIGSIKLPWYVLYAVVLVIIMWFIWNKTTFGKNMFAVGSNPEAASVSGVNVFKTTVMVHTLAGIMYGLNGFIEAARLGSVTQGTGLNYECEAIAACVIGGVSFVGGTGKISGIVLGVFILRIIFAALNFLGINANMQYIIKGGIILFACALDMRKYLVKK